MAELPDTGSDASIESRLNTLFGAEESAPEADSASPEAAAQDAAAETTEEGDAADESADATPDEIEDEIEGVKVRGAKDAVERLKSERASKADYTRRTQEAANLAKAAEDRIQYAQAQQQIVGALMGDYARLEAVRERVNQLQSIDIGALYNSDPGQALNIQRQIAQLKDQAAEQEKTLSTKASQLQAAQQAHANKQWELAVEGAKQRIGNFTSAEDVAMLNQVRALGFNENELRGRFADPRFLQLVYKAAKFDAIAAGKATSLQSMQKAPPVMKPGASVPGAAASRAVNDARLRLKKSGRMEDAAALFLRMK